MNPLRLMVRQEKSELLQLLERKFRGLSEKEKQRVRELVQTPVYSKNARECHACRTIGISPPDKEIYDTLLCQAHARITFEPPYSG